MSNLSELSQKHKELQEEVSKLESLIAYKLESFKTEQLPLSLEDLDSLMQLLSNHKEDNEDSVWGEFSMMNYYSSSFVEYLTEWILSKETFVPEEIEKYLKICSFPMIELDLFIQWYRLYPKRFKELYNFICNHKDGGYRYYGEGWLILIESVLKPKLKLPKIEGKVEYENRVSSLKGIRPYYHRSSYRHLDSLNFMVSLKGENYSSFLTLKLSELLNLKTYE